MNIKIGNFVYYSVKVNKIRTNIGTVHSHTIGEFNIVIDDSMAFRFDSLSEMNYFIEILKKKSEELEKEWSILIRQTMEEEKSKESGE